MGKPIFKGQIIGRLTIVKKVDLIIQGPIMAEHMVDLIMKKLIIEGLIMEQLIIEKQIMMKLLMTKLQWVKLILKVILTKTYFLVSFPRNFYFCIYFFFLIICPTSAEISFSVLSIFIYIILLTLIYFS